VEESRRIRKRRVVRRKPQWEDFEPGPLEPASNRGIALRAVAVALLVPLALLLFSVARMIVDSL
jgi:hypothetical protein